MSILLLTFCMAGVSCLYATPPYHCLSCDAFDLPNFLSIPKAQPEPAPTCPLSVIRLSAAGDLAKLDLQDFRPQRRLSLHCVLGLKRIEP